MKHFSSAYILHDCTEHTLHIILLRVLRNRLMKSPSPLDIEETLNSPFNDDDSDHSEVSSHDELAIADEVLHQSEFDQSESSLHGFKVVTADHIRAVTTEGNNIPVNKSALKDLEKDKDQADGVVHSGPVEIQHDYFEWDAVHHSTEQLAESDHNEINVTALRPQSSPLRIPLPRDRISLLSDGKDDTYDETNAIDYYNRSDSGFGRDGALAELGLTTIDIAELLLNRGTKNLVRGRYSDVFHNFNGAYKLLFEGDGNVADSYEHDMSIKSQLNGLTRLSLLADIENMYKLLMIDVCKEEAQAMFESESFDGAIKKYDEVLVLVPLHGECLTSRASCMLAAHDPEGCIGDCDLALKILNAPMRRASGKFQNDGVDIARCVAVAPRDRKAWKVKTYQLRGAAHSQLNRLDEAVADYRSAVALDPKNESSRFGLRKSIVLKQLETTKGSSTYPESHFNVDGSIRIQDPRLPVIKGCFWNVFRSPPSRTEMVNTQI